MKRKIGKRKKDITIPIHTDSYILRTAFWTPLVADYPTSLPATLVSVTLLCISSFLPFSFVGCFSLFPRLFLLRVITFFFGYLSDHPLSWCRPCPSSPSRRTHAHANPQLLVHSFPSITLFISFFFSRFHITREISERCRGTGKPSPERTVDGEPVVLRPPVNAFWIPPGLAYVIGRPSLTSTHP